MKTEVLGDFDSGFTISCQFPSHLGGEMRGLVLTPATAREVYAALDKRAWRPMATAPKDRPILARGPSGYREPCHVRYLVVRWREYTKDPETSYEFKTTDATGRWDDYTGDRVTDGGPMVEEWRDL